MKIDNNRLERLNEIQNNLGYTFQDIGLLNCALTHKSYTNEEDKNMENNERLEFLGDAVIDLIVSEYFYKRYPSWNEGDLTKIRAALVNESSLASISKRIELGRYMLLGKGEDMTGGREKPSILANVFEAIIASIYLDSTIKKAYERVICYLQKEIDLIVADHRRCSDFKSRLQEYSQQNYSAIPSYNIIRESGPDHDKCYHTEVIINNVSKGKGTGKSKKEAEQAAARDAISNYNNSAD